MSQEDSEKMKLAIVRAALDSGAINKGMTIDEMVTRLGKDISPVAGYVAAWERYVLVVSKEPQILPRVQFAKE